MGRTGGRKELLGWAGNITYQDLRSQALAQWTLGGRHRGKGVFGLMSAGLHRLNGGYSIQGMNWRHSSKMFLWWNM